MIKIKTSEKRINPKRFTWKEDNHCLIKLIKEGYSLINWLKKI